MKIVIEIDEERLNTIRRIANVQHYRSDLTLEQIIDTGTPLTEVFDDIKAEIEKVIVTNMGIDGEEDFDKWCKMCLAIIDRHISTESEDKK